jgi:hypothetical protein
MNQSMKRGTFYLVELIRYQSKLAVQDGQTMTAYAGQIVARPERQAGGPATRIGEAELLDSITDEPYRLALQRIFDACKASGLTFGWGTRGASIRLATQDRAEPLSIAWIFPPDSTYNWSGLSHLTLGYDTESLVTRPSVKERVEQYANDALRLPDATPAKRQGLVAATFEPASVVSHETQLINLITETVAAINDSGQLA